MRVLVFGQPLWGDASHLALYHSAHGHEVRTAGPGPGFDYTFAPYESTVDFLARLAPEWMPEVLLCNFPEMYPPTRAIEDSPIPTVAVISDWNLYGPQLEHNLCRFDAVLSDQQATQRLKVHGIVPQHLFPMYSQMTHIHRRIERPREIDVLFLGNLNHAIHRERGAMLEHVARNAHDFRLVIDAGLPPDDYALRLNESKIALNFGVRGEMNLRCFEAPACGALLFIEEENRETFDWLEAEEQCIPYTRENVVERIRYFLEHEDERERIADAGHRRILELAAEKRLDMLFNWIARVPRGPRAFAALDPQRRALADALLYGSSMNAEQRAFSHAQLHYLHDAHPQDAEALLAWGCSNFDHAAAQGKSPAQRDARRELLRESIKAFDAAQAAAPDEAVPLLNLATLARQAGATVEDRYLQRATEAKQAQHGAYLLGRVHDPFYAAWRLALGFGDAPLSLLHAQAHTRLAELALARREAAAALSHAQAAITIAPQIGAAYTLAGRAAQALGDLDAAATLLREGLPHTSFDAAHRQALLEVLRARGDAAEAAALAEESSRIFAACVPYAAYADLFRGA